MSTQVATPAAPRTARFLGRRPPTVGQSARLGLLFISPWLLGFVGFFAYPFFATIYYSFTDFDGTGQPRWLGLSNYTHLFHDHLFWVSIYNTMFYTVFELPLSTIVALGLALLLNLDVKGRAFYRTIFYIPSIVPVVASCLIFVWIFNPATGVVNSILSDVHVTGPDWFFSTGWSKPSLILLGLWGVGQPMVIYLAGLQGIPKEMYEVADLEGAGPLQRLRFVTLPQLSPVILFNVILQLVACLAYFTQAQVIESTDPGGPGTSTWFYVQYLYQQAFSFLKLGYAAAMAFFLFVTSAIVMVGLFRLSNRWVYYASEG